VSETTPRTHAPRRDPATPDGPLDIAAEGRALLEQAHNQRSGRQSRTLTPGAGAGLSQTLLALTSGTVLEDHRAPGPATIHVLSGNLTLTVDGDETPLGTGTWATIPQVAHGLRADTDATALLTVAPHANAGR
jgi:quercetin dioxygenase-like cupin family protein